MCAFLHFTTERRRLLEEQNPSLGVGAIAKQLSSEWCLMTPQQRRPYTELAEREKERYEQQKQAYEAGYLAGYCAASLQRGISPPAQDPGINGVLTSGHEMANGEMSTLASQWGINQFSLLEIERESRGRSSVRDAGRIANPEGRVSSRVSKPSTSGQIARGGAEALSIPAGRHASGSRIAAKVRGQSGSDRTPTSRSGVTNSDVLGPMLSRTNTPRSGGHMSTPISGAPQTGDLLALQTGSERHRIILRNDLPITENSERHHILIRTDSPRADSRTLTPQTGGPPNLRPVQTGQSNNTMEGGVGRRCSAVDSCEDTSEEHSGLEEVSAFPFSSELSVLESVGENSVLSVLNASGHTTETDIRSMPLLSPVKITKRGKKKTKSCLPRRSMSAFLFYSLENRAAAKETYPSFSSARLAQCLGTSWKEMDASERQKYEIMAARDKKRYKEEVHSFKMGQYKSPGMTPREIAHAVTNGAVSPSSPQQPSPVQQSPQQPSPEQLSPEQLSPEQPLPEQPLPEQQLPDAEQLPPNKKPRNSIID